MALNVGVLMLGPVAVLVVQGTLIAKSAGFTYIGEVFSGSQALSTSTFVKDVPLPTF